MYVCIYLNLFNIEHTNLYVSARCRVLDAGRQAPGAGAWCWVSVDRCRVPDALALDYFLFIYVNI